MLVNYLLGGYLLRHPSRLVLGLAVAANVLLLVYYKYTGFLLGTLDAALDLGWRVEDIILPLAISFFTFQQIAYLVDAHDGVVEEHDFANYCLFRSEEHTSELQSLMRISYAVFCLKKKTS